MENSLWFNRISFHNTQALYALVLFELDSSESIMYSIVSNWQKPGSLVQVTVT